MRKHFLKNDFTLKIRSVTSFLVMLICSTHIFAGSLEYRSVINTTSLIVSGNSIRTQDLSYSTSIGANLECQYETKVHIHYGRQNRSDVNPIGTIDVTYDITSNLGTILRSGEHIKLDIASGVYEAQNSYTGIDFSNLSDVILKITSVTKTGFGAGFNPDDIQLELALAKNWYKNILNVSTPTIESRLDGKEQLVYWSYIPGAESYELEYVFIDKYDNNYASINANNVFDHLDPLVMNITEGVHYKEPISIELTNTYYPIYLNFPEGTLYYRVRPKGNLFATSYTHSEEKNVGTWSTTIGIATIAYESNKLWQMANTFAEEGKHKIVQTYADGSSRTRQTQTYISSSRQTVVAESKYDYEGRPTVQILPSVEDGVNMDYKSIYNRNSSGAAFEKDMFDKNYTMAPALSTTSGSAKYYSTSNTSTSINKDYIPDAQGFVYTQVRYMRDGTGRPEYQSGVGSTHSIKSGHETRYIYGKTNSTELERMFGSNVGVSVHYKKNLVIDANGQASVSYLDQEGRTIATALAGDEPDNLIKLDENIVSPITANLMGNNIVDKANRISSLSDQITNVIPNTTYSFHYDMQGIINKLGAPFNICQSCRYHLDISVTDPDNIPVTLTISGGGGSATQISATCMKTGSIDCVNDISFSGSNIDFTALFTKMGVYTVEKSLYMTEGDITAMLEFLQEAENFPDSVAIFNDYLFRVDSSLCDLTCEGIYSSPCEQYYRATNSSWNSMSAVDKQYWIDRCADSCCSILTEQGIAKIDECKTFLDQMKSAITPDEDIIGYKYTWWNSATFSPGVTSITVGGSTITPTVAQLTTYSLFNESWLDALVVFHREYCHYSKCNNLRTSDNFDDKISIIQTYANATNPLNNRLGVNVQYLFDTPGASKPLPSTDTYLEDDAFFSGASSTSHPKHAYYTTMLNRITDYKGSGLSIWDFYAPGTITSVPIGGGSVSINVNTMFYSGMTDPTEINNRRWRLMLGAYLAAKREIVDDWQVNSTSPLLCEFVNDANAIVKPSANNLPTDAAGIDAFLSEHMSDYVADMCAGNLTAWKMQLMTACPALTSAGFDANIASHLLRYCNTSAGLSNPMGVILSTDLSSNTHLLAVQSYLTSLSCSGALSGISATSPYTTVVVGGSPVTYDYSAVDPCLLNLFSYLNASSYPLPDHTSTYAITSTSAALSACYSSGVNNITHYDLQGGGNNPNKNYIDISFINTNCNPQHLNIVAESGLQFVNIQSVTNLRYVPTFPAFACSTITPPVGGYAYEGEYTKVMMDVKLHGDPTIYAGYLFANGCSGSSCSAPNFDCNCSLRFINEKEGEAVMPNTNSPEYVNNTLDLSHYRDTCIEDLIAQIAFLATAEYHRQVERFYASIGDYASKCFDNPFEEHFFVSYNLQEYHYTLYYYDQAGNLVQTVPPDGVNLLTAADFNNGKRISGHEPNHRLKTNYLYNSLNAVRKQNTPDAGLTAFYYDNKGQLKVSQNAKQAINDDYSFTQYDKLGRITMVGEQHVSYPPDLSRLALTDGRWYVNIGTDAYTHQKELTFTVYSAASTNAHINQENLRGRVSQVYKAENLEALVLAAFSSDFSKTSATYYSYDIHGNVKQLEQQVYDFDYKTTDYAYDLISGKVNSVYYQKGQSDQFIHKYEYDADNRLTNVYTSTDDRNYVEDARYFYYAHGPLARTEYGAMQVQGLDYSYTLHGWLKGVNMPLESGNDMTQNDPGKDANTSLSTNINKYIAEDAMAFGLGYYQGDYTPIGSGISMGALANTSWSAHASLIKGTLPNKGLYNGNIVYMSTSIAPDLSVAGSHPFTHGPSQTLVYQYDQLNRIKQSRSNQLSGTWNTNRYGENFSFDQNGNIKTLQRRDQNAALMDDMSYYYDYEAGQDGFSGTAPYWLESNRLYHVKDAINGSIPDDYYNAANANTADASIQSANNFGYDAIGNLVRDDIENISNISWNVYGKITHIDKSGTLDDLEYRYDAMGNRVMKIVKNNGSVNVVDWDITYYLRDASGNIMATYERDHTWVGNNPVDIEYPIYGSSRIGVYTHAHSYSTGAIGNSIIDFGEKQYELANHLGNVLVTTSDLRKGADNNADGIADYYNAIVTTANDYFAFGSLMGGRQYNSTGYVYSFNTQLKSDEISGNGNHTTALFWEYDTRLGRRWNVDPKTITTLGTYSCFADNPVRNTDKNGDLWKVSNGTVCWITPEDLYQINSDGIPQLPNVNTDDIYTLYATYTYDNCMNITGIMVYNENGTTNTYTVNAYGLVQLPDGTNDITNYSPNDIETTEGDMYVNPTTAVAFYKTLGKFRMSHEGKIAIGDASTSTGNSPRVEISPEKRHATHYRGNAIDGRYLDKDGNSIKMPADADKFSKSVTDEFLELAEEYGLDQQYVGTDNTFDNMNGVQIAGHNNHWHIGTTPISTSQGAFHPTIIHTPNGGCPTQPE